MTSRHAIAALLTIIARIFFACVLLQSPIAHAADEFLDPELVFKFSAKMADAKTAEVTYVIADGYYMYRKRFHFTADGAKLGEPVMPTGKIKFDETFQENVETYHDKVVIRIPVEANGAFTLHSTGQGCAEKGLCYAPMSANADLSAGVSTAKINAPVEQMSMSQSMPMDMPKPAAQTVSANVEKAEHAGNPADAEMGRIEASLKGGKLLAIMPLFLLLGLGLAFTPCVLPMVPILSFIIVGEGSQVRRSRGFTLSATYSLGMAIVYTALGIAAGLIGEGLSTALQNQWVLGAFGLLLAAMSLSMFGVFQLQMPASIQLKLMKASEKQTAGKLLGVFVMGAISALIVGPCVAAPLAGALVYISQTRDVVVGGSALFAMAVGMSLPLLLVGISAGSLLPRAGAWMDAVKRFFGVLMLALALWMVSPVIPAWTQMLGWAALGIGYGIYMLQAGRSGWQGKTMGLVFAVFGLVQLIGVASGGRDVLAPLAHLNKNQIHQLPFTRIKSLSELDAALAHTNGKAALLDFYADWCVSCKEMEKLTFSDPRVQAQFANLLLLQIDVTAISADDKAMLRRFNLFGPPGIIFFDRQGHEIPGGRVIGYQDAEKFLHSLSLISGS